MRVDSRKYIMIITIVFREHVLLPASGLFRVMIFPFLSLGAMGTVP